MRLVRLTLLVLALGFLTVIGAAIPGHAHALLERSDPPAYRLLLKPPDAIVLRFSEAADPAGTRIIVQDQDGGRVDQPGLHVSADGRQARVRVRFSGPGIYTVAWRTLSRVDQHTYEGFFTITVGPLRPGSFTLSAGKAPEPAPWEVAARWLIFLGAAVLGGGFLTHRVLVASVFSGRHEPVHEPWPLALERRWRMAAWLSSLTFLLGSVAELAFQAQRAAQAAGQTLGTSLALLATSDPLRGILLLKIVSPAVLLLLTFGRSTAVELPSVGLVASPARGALEASVMLAVVALLPLGISLTSHAAASSLLLPLLADWLHLLSASVWIGGLVYLVAILAPILTHVAAQDRIEFLGPFTQRFSNLALTSVVALVATGSYAAWNNIPDVNAVTATAYGRTLAVKIAFLIPVLGIAAVNLLVIRPRLLQAARRMIETARALAVQRRFFRQVRSEAILGTVILLAAAVLALLPTSRQVRALTPLQVPFVLVRQTQGLEARLRIGPYHVGENTFEVTVQEAAGAPISDARVRISFTPLMEHFGTAIAEAAAEGNGRFTLQGTYLSTRGPWMVTVTVRRRGKEDDRFLYLVEPDWEGTEKGLARPTDPQALALLRSADGAMNRLHTARQRQELADGRGGTVVVFSEFAAPNAVDYRVVGGLEGILIGQKRFVNDGGTWSEAQFSEPYKFPNSTFADHADSVVFGPREIVDDISTQAVVFILKSAGANARYAVWIDEKSHRILQETMAARAHYMISRDYDFNAPLEIRPPVGR